MSKQGEISGLSRSISNLGSSFGTAIAGTILITDLASSNKNAPYILAMAALAGFALVGFAAAILLPSDPVPKPDTHSQPGDRGTATPISDHRESRANV